MKYITLLFIAALVSCSDFNVIVTDDGCLMQQQDQYLVGVCGNVPTIQWTNQDGQELRAQKINDKFRFYIKDGLQWRLIGAKENVDLGGMPNE
jgi:hypothetical protein